MRFRHLDIFHQTKHLRGLAQGEHANQGRVPSREGIVGSILKGARHDGPDKNLGHSNTRRRRYTSHTFRFPVCDAKH